MNKPTKLQSILVSAATSLLFVLVYGNCNRITAQRHDVGTWFYSWETHIPLIPLMIIPYMTIDAFFVAAPFLCRTRSELATFARRITFSILIAGCFFLLLPLKMGIPRPEPSGWTGSIFKFLHGFDQPYNLFPSLHITLRTILAAVYVRHTRGVIRWASRIWFSLIGFSTLLTYQHHIVDVLGGFALAGIAFYLFREQSSRLPVISNHRVGTCYAIGAIATALLSLAAWPWTALLIWPAVSLVIVAIAYFGLGPGIYRKTNGRLPITTRVLLAPCLLGQYLSLIYYRHTCAPWNKLTESVWIGTKPTARQAHELKRLGVTAVLDLTSEFTEPTPLVQAHYKNVPILDLTAPNRGQLSDGAAFIEQHTTSGIVYIHCKVGYSRTAAVAGAWLLSSGRAHTPAEAVATLRHSRPSIIIRPEALTALQTFQPSTNTGTIVPA